MGGPVQTSLASPGVSVNRLHPSGAADFSSVQGESTPVPGMGSSEEHRGQQDQQHDESLLRDPDEAHL